MFGKSKNLLIDFVTQSYLDQTFDRIASVFNDHNLPSKQAIFPKEFLQNSYTPNDFGFNYVVSELCNFMSIDPRKINFSLLVSDQNIRALNNSVHGTIESDGPAGTFEIIYNTPHISIQDSILKEPMRFISVLAHELSHYKLLVEKRYTADEYMTDMLPTFFGLGIFTSSTVFFQKNFNSAGMQGWTMSKTGYLSEYMHGYLLAKWTLFIGKNPMEIRKDLKPNVFQSYRKTLKTLGEW